MFVKATGALCLLLLASSHEADAKKIVWVPFPGSVSHHMLAAKVGKELAARGHEFIAVNTDYDGQQFSKIDFTGIKQLLYKHPWSVEKMHAFLESIADVDPFSGTREMVNMSTTGCATLLETKEVIDAIKDADVIVVDAAVNCGSIVRDFLKIPIRVDFLPVTFYDPFYTPRLGSSNQLSIVPQMGSHLTTKMDFGQRIHNTIVHMVNNAIIDYIADPIADELRQRYGLEGTHAEAMADTGILITQMTWMTEFPRAVAPAVKLVGPILPEAAKELPAGELKDFVDAADTALIVSFGSQARVAQTVVDKMAEAFGRLEGVRVVWKTPGLRPQKVPSNVFCTKWFPQNDLLGHPKVNAFLSHGGFNGVNEAAYHGVPVVGFPLFADQFDNIARLQYRGMGVTVDSKKFTPDSLVDDINKVLNTPSFAESASKVSRVVKDTPRKPTELAADWIEYAIRHDGAMFHQIEGLQQSWFVANGWDVLLALVGSIAVLVYAVFKCGAAVCCKSAAASKSDKKTK